jgi:hypothetical protein
MKVEFSMLEQLVATKAANLRTNDSAFCTASLIRKKLLWMGYI